VVSLTVAATAGRGASMGVAGAGAAAGSSNTGGTKGALLATVVGAKSGADEARAPPLLGAVNGRVDASLHGTPSAVHACMLPQSASAKPARIVIVNRRSTTRPTLSWQGRAASTWLGRRASPSPPTEVVTAMSHGPR
jgi:hypothetical protein